MHFRNTKSTFQKGVFFIAYVDRRSQVLGNLRRPWNVACFNSPFASRGTKSAMLEGKLIIIPALGH